MSTEERRGDAKTRKTSVEAGEKSLPIRHTNIFLLVSFLLLLIIPVIPIPKIPRSWVNLFAYIPILVVAVILCRKNETSLWKAFRFSGAKPVSFLLSIVIVFAMQPCVRLISSLTNLLIPNGMSAVQSNVEESNLVVNLIGYVLIPACFEELIFRGGAFNSFRRTGRLRLAVLLSAAMFGLLHMNGSQLFYAAFIGIIIAVMFMLTDSIWPGVLLHALNNGIGIVIAHLMGIYDQELIRRIFLPYTAWGLDTPATTAVTIAGAVVGLALTGLCLFGIAKAEGRTDQLRQFVKGGGKKSDEKLFTLPLIICLVLMVVATVLFTAALGLQDQLAAVH